MKERVLLVDDDDAMREVMGRVLTRAGFEVVQAESGEQALALAAAQHFDGALFDKNMGGMDGIELLAHLRKRQPRCACILMTGLPSVQSAVEALRLGAADYLTKPSPELDRVGDRLRAMIAARGGEMEALAVRVRALEAELQHKEQELASLHLKAVVDGDLD